MAVVCILMLIYGANSQSSGSLAHDYLKVRTALLV